MIPVNRNNSGCFNNDRNGYQNFNYIQDLKYCVESSNVNALRDVLKYSPIHARHLSIDQHINFLKEIIVKSSKEFLIEYLEKQNIPTELTSKNQLDGPVFIGLAANYKDAETVQLLIDYGMDVNDVRGSDGLTACIYAASHGKTDILDVLIKAGANIHESDKHGNILLSNAIKHKQYESVKMLISNGINISSVNSYYMVYLSINNNDLSYLNDFIGFGGKFLINDPKTMDSPLHNIVPCEKQKEIINFLIDHGVPAHGRDCRGFTPFMLAVEGEYEPLLKSFAALPGFNIDDRCFHEVGGFAEHEVGGYKPEDFLFYQDTLQYCMDFDELRGQFWFNETALMIAARSGIVDTVQTVLDLGAQINLTNNEGKTSLMIAADYECHEVVQALCSRGANVGAVDPNGWTALAFAVNSESMLTVNALLAASVDVNQRFADGNTALMLAAERNNVDIADILYRSGASLDMINFSGENALAVAQDHGNIEVAEFLATRRAIAHAG